MRKKTVRVLRLAAVVLSCGAAYIPSVAAARTPNIHPLPQRQLGHQARPQSHSRTAIGPHHFFGTILAIRGGILTIRRRNGTLTTVDATLAIANDNYSYPLFIGKMVAVDGAYSAKIFVATDVQRITSLKALENDD
jgi:hypothetical protein